MRTCLVALSLILAIEGYLACVSGLAAVAGMLGGMVLVGGMASFWKRRGGEWGWVMLVALYVVAAIATSSAGYLSGIIVAASSLHFVAWYFAARAIRFGAPDLVPGTLDGRPGIFAVAFYGVLGLAVVLMRRGIFPVSVELAVLLAFVLVVLGLVVMEKGRFLKMREGAPDRASRKRGIAARGLALLALLCGMFFVFSKPVPVAADGLVKMALELQGKTEDSGLDADDMPDLDDIPMRDVPLEEVEEPGAGAAAVNQRAGDSMSQARALPPRADLQGSHVPQVHLELASGAQAAALAQRPIYVRSSTLGRYSGGEWRRVGGDAAPLWLTDAEDGREDGRVTLARAFPEAPAVAELRYKIYVRGATGAGLLALQGVSAFELPQVLRYDDDWYRARLVGDVVYGAASRPLSLEDLLGDGDLEAGDPGMDGVYVEVEDTPLMSRIEGLLAEMPVGSLAERLLWLKQFLAANYAYSPKIDNAERLEPLENFLFEEKRGYCDFFATAGALMARMIGVPSRVAYGFTKGEFDGENVFTFHEDGAHSWPEIFLESYGWVVFDVTPAGSQGGTAAGEVAAEGERPDLSGFDSGEMIEPDAGGAGAGGEDDQAAARVGGKGSAVSDLVSYIVFCFALLAFAFWYYLKRDPAREAAKEDGRRDVDGRKLPAYLVEFGRLLRSFGLDPQRGETVVEMLRALRGAGVPAEGFEAMKRYHYSTRYEDQPVDPRAEKQFLQEVRAFLKEHSTAGK